jgi:hypothetical protein
MILKPTNVHKCMKVYYTHCLRATCFGHSYGHLQGGALQRIHTHRNITELNGTNADIYKTLNFKTIYKCTTYF